MQQVLKVQVPFADYATADDAVDDRKAVWCWHCRPGKG